MPGTKTCAGIVVRICNAEGNGWTELECCSAGLSCNMYTYTCTGPIICTPNKPLCDGSTAATCSADGTSYASATPCADVGKVCYQGTCLDCWPTSYFCSGATVRHCAADGKSSTLITTCASGQYCDTAATTCQAQICTPNQPACDGETATTCKADGSGYVAGGTPCTDAGQLCHQGACAPLACSPGADFCSGSTLRRCAEDGMSSTVLAACTGSVYCDSAVAACKPIVCTPNQATCDGTIAVTCSADGSGYASRYDCLGVGELCLDGRCQYGPMSDWTFCSGSQVVRCHATGDCESRAKCNSLQYCDDATVTCQPLLCAPNQPTCSADNTPVVCSASGMGYVNDGTPCGSQLCVSGACRDALFADDFEDADFAGWLGVQWSITTTHAASSTQHCLRGGYGNVYRTFADLKPKRVSWWVMAGSDSAESGHFVLTSTSEQDRLIATSYFTGDAKLVLVRNIFIVEAEIPCTANLWYHIELRSFDWTAKTFDYYVNDTLLRAAVPFQDAGATSIGRLELSNPGAVTACWDEITFD